MNYHPNGGAPWVIGAPPCSMGNRWWTASVMSNQSNKVVHGVSENRAAPWYVPPHTRR